MKRRILIPLLLVCAGLTLAACTRKHSLYLSPGEREEEAAAQRRKPAPAKPSGPTEAAPTPAKPA